MSDDVLAVEVTAETRSAALADAIAQGKVWFELDSCVYATLGNQLGTEVTESLGGERPRARRTFEAFVSVVHHWQPSGGACQRCGLRVYGGPA